MAGQIPGNKKSWPGEVKRFIGRALSRHTYFWKRKFRLQGWILELFDA
jgi:hypothetical protein